MPEIFRTDRLIIRDISLDDVDDAFRIYSSRRFAEVFAMPQVETKEEMRIKLQERIDRTESYDDGLGMWAIQRIEEGDMVGLVALKPLGETGLIEVGWHLWPEVWGRGFATEAGRAAIAHGFESLNLDQITAIIRPENVQSQGVAKRLGMKQSNQQSIHAEMIHDHWTIDREDWNSA